MQNHLWVLEQLTDQAPYQGIKTVSAHTSGGTTLHASYSHRVLAGFQRGTHPNNIWLDSEQRAVQAMQAAGLKVARVELHGGKVLIIPADDEEVADDSNNSFDKIMRAK